MEICLTCSVGFSGRAFIISGVLKKSMRGLFSHSRGATGAAPISMSINKPYNEQNDPMMIYSKIQLPVGLDLGI